MTKKSLPVLFFGRFKDFLELSDNEKAVLDIDAFYLDAFTDTNRVVSVYKDKKFVLVTAFHFVKDLHDILWRDYQEWRVDSLQGDQKDFMFFELLKIVSFYFESFVF